MPKALLAPLTLAALLCGRSALAQLPLGPAPEPPAAATPAPPAASEQAAPEGSAPAAIDAALPASAASDSARAAEAEPAAPRAVTEPAPSRATQLRASRAGVEMDDADDAGLELDAVPRRKWYGWQTLTADALSVLVLAAASGVDTKDDSLLWAGLLSYELSPGILHFVHRNPGRAFASFGLRLGMPVAGAVLGAAMSARSKCDDAHCREDVAAVGLWVGMAGAMALDAAVFAYESPQRGRHASAPKLAPVIHISAQHSWLGVAGEL